MSAEQRVLMLVLCLMIVSDLFVFCAFKSVVSSCVFNILF